MAGQSITYKADPADQRLVEPLDEMTLIYQRRSGITHLVAEPVPQILAIMGDEALSATAIAHRLASKFDLNAEEAVAVVAARLEELAKLGFVERDSV